MMRDEAYFGLNEPAGAGLACLLAGMTSWWEGLVAEDNP
jgi:hypothetical protein